MVELIMKFLFLNIPHAFNCYMYPVLVASTKVCDIPSCNLSVRETLPPDIGEKWRYYRNTRFFKRHTIEQRETCTFITKCLCFKIANNS